MSPHALLHRRWAILAAAALLVQSAGCGSSTPAGPKPEPALGSSGSSQLEFRQLARAWHAATAEGRNQLEPGLREFLQKYPRDPLRRPANAYLAWILVQKGQLVEARQRIELARAGPAGSAQDFATVAEAALLTQRGRPDAAMKRLRPLHGKIIDPVERFLATQQLVQAGMAAGYYGEVLLYMVDWLHQAAERDRAHVRDAAESLLRRVPANYLREALLRLEPAAHDAEREQVPLRFAQRRWLHAAITRRLGSVAIETHDVELAQSVLTHNPALAGAGGDSDELVRLAAGAELSVSVSGRTVGLLLATANDTARRRSAEVASGLAAALRDPAVSGDALTLVFAEDAGDDTERALHELATSGAALIVAGVDARSAVGAARYAERVQVPVLLLEPVRSSSDYVFTLGVSEVQQRDVLMAGLAAGGTPPIHTVGLEPDDCATPQVAGAPRFAAADWRASGTRALLMMTGPGCVREVRRETRRAGFEPTFALGLDAAAAASDLAGAELLWIRTAHFPGQSGPAALQRFAAQRQRAPTWYETLGHDAGAIARAALMALPAIRSEDPREVELFHGRVRQALAGTSGLELWSSGQARFDAQRALLRQLDYERQAK